MIMKKLFFNSLFYLFVSVFFVLLTGCYGDASGSSSGSSSDPVAQNKYVYSVSYDSKEIYTYGIEENGTLREIWRLPLSENLSPRWIMVTPYNAYVVSNNVGNNQTGYLSSYKRDPNTGKLTECGGTDIETGNNPGMGVVTPSGKYLYVLNEGDGGVGGAKVAQYKVGNACTLTRILPDMDLLGMSPDSIVVDPGSKYVYVTGTNPNQILAYRISNTGALQAQQNLTTSLGYAPFDIAIAPSGLYAYVTSASSPGGVYQYSRGVDNGELTALNPESVTAGADPIGLVLSPSGNNAYVTNSGSNTISQYSIDTVTGILTPITDAPPTVTSGESPYGITVTPSGKYLYVTNQTGGSISMYSIADDGVLSPLSNPSITTGNSPYGIFAW